MHVKRVQNQWTAAIQASNPLASVASLVRERLPIEQPCFSNLFLFLNLVGCFKLADMSRKVA